MKKSEKSSSIQRRRDPALRVTYDELFQHSRENFSEEAIHAAMGSWNFRHIAKTDDILHALILAHNREPREPLVFINPSVRPALQVFPYRPRFLNKAMKWLICTQSLNQKEAVSNPEAVAITVCFREPPFSVFHPFWVRNEGSLYNLMTAAQHIACVHGCTLETAIEVCMTDTIKMARLLPDPMTIKAVKFVLSAMDLPPDHAGLDKELDKLPWDLVRKFLKIHLRSDVREHVINSMRYDPEEDPEEELESHLFPKFCHSVKECKQRISRATISMSRLFMNLEPATDGYMDPATWHQIPDLVGMKKAFLSGRLKLVEFGKESSSNLPTV